jgi:flagellar operon protein
VVDNVFFPNPVVVNPDRQRLKQQPQIQRKPDGKPSAFDQVLNQKLPASDGIKFSQHAQDRLRSRGITINEAEMGLLNTAVNNVAQKGGKESLIMMGDAAFVVSVKNRIVVTAMDRSQMQGNVFTNIDSAVVI